MTQKLTALGRLTAAEGRVLRGMLLPYGVPGYTNLGRVVASRGVIDVPEDLSTLSADLDHEDGLDDVAAFRSVEETDAGLLASWDVPKTHGGDKLLAEYRAGKRTGVSVELEPVRIADGAIVGGTLVGCAFPEKPAFDTARLVASLAPDTPEDEDEEVDTDDPELDDAPDAAAGDEPDDDTADDDEDALDDDTTTTATQEGTPTMTAATASRTRTPARAPRDLVLHAQRSPEKLTASSITTPGEFYALMAAAHRTRNGRLLAALADIVPSSIADRDVPQWVGELWSGNAYQRRIVPLLNHADLTSMELKGWKWTEKPEMQRYTGNKTNVPSNPVSTEPAAGEAIRLAGAHDIDRKYKDFNDTAFFEAYYAAMSESYARQSDLYAAEVLKENAPVVPMGTVPSGVPVGWVAVVDGALAIIDRGAPTFALVEKSVWRDMILTGTDKFFEFLNASLSFEEGTVNSGNFKLLPVSSTAVGDASSLTGLDKGEVLVGARQAVTIHELSTVPIRVEAVDMARGGVDEGAFGYIGSVVHEASALALVDTSADV